jgi:hypothetical protein
MYSMLLHIFRIKMCENKNISLRSASVSFCDVHVSAPFVCLFSLVELMSPYEHVERMVEHG